MDIDSLVTIALSALASFCSVLAGYVLIKRSFDTEVLIDKTHDLFDEIRKDTELQQKIAMIGVLLGSGIKSGVGLGKGNSKRGLEQMLMEFGMQWFGSKMGVSGQQQPQQGAVNPWADQQ